MNDLKKLNVYLVKYKFRLILGLFFVALSNIFAIYPAQLVRKSFDELKDKLTILGKVPLVDKQMLIDDIISQVAFYGLLILIMAFLKGLFMFFMRQTIIVTSRLIEGDLKNEIYAHYQRLDFSFYKTNRTGDLMARISEDVSRVRMYLGPAIMYIANLVTTFIIVIIVMVKVNPTLTFLVITPLPILSYFIYKISSSINRKSEKLQQRLSDLSSFAQESFSGIRILKAYSIEGVWQKKFETAAENYRLQAMRLNKTDSFFTPAVAAIVGLSTLIIVYCGGILTAQGELTTGNIAEFIIYVNLLIWPVTSLGWVSSLIQRAAASQKRINEFLQTPPKIVSGIEQVDAHQTIEFKSVSFIYPETGIKALTNISFKAYPNQTVGIVGKTGSGKSTLIQLLLRFYDPTDGIILIGNQHLNNVDIGSFRNQCGWVPQDAFLFSDTIRNNLLIGNEKATESEIENACRLAEVWDNIQSFPDKLDTVVGERGITLSGGQKQRITIARALLKKPKILILDDCLSAVDTNTEARLLNNLKKVYHLQTTFLVSHRVATVKDADVILVLDNGQIIEKGKHAELINQNGIYAQLNQLQLTLSN